MDVLLDVVVARQPGEVIPVAQLIFHVAPARLPRPHGSRGPGVVCRLHGHDLADRSIVDAADYFAFGRVVAVTETGDDRQIAAFCFLAGGKDRPAARSVDRHGFLDEGVFVGVNRCPQMHGPEVRRRRQQHHIDAAIDDLLIGIKTDELPLGHHADLVPDGGAAAQLRQAAGERFWEGVPHGPQLGTGIGQQGIFGGAGTPAAAADEADFECFVADGMHERSIGQGEGAGGGRGRFEKLAAVTGCFHHRSISLE